MSWWEVLIAVPVMSLIGSFAGVAQYRMEERRYGRIKAERDEFTEAARALGVNPNEARSIGIMCTAYGLRHEDVKRMVGRWASGRP